VGGNIFGQIENGNSDNVLIPYHVKGLNCKKVKAIACGNRHSMALTENGNVFSWGQNEYGQVGIGTKVNCNSPKLIELNKVFIEKVNCGSDYSLFLSNDRNVYLLGRNSFGVLGVPCSA